MECVCVLGEGSEARARARASVFWVKAQREGKRYGMCVFWVKAQREGYEQSVAMPHWLYLFLDIHTYPSWPHFLPQLKLKWFK